MLWVVTSTFDRKKGILIDVFNPEGKYVDSFYLQFPGIMQPKIVDYTRMYIGGEFLYRIESREDGSLVIRKYKLMTE